MLAHRRRKIAAQGPDHDRTGVPKGYDGPTR